MSPILLDTITFFKIGIRQFFTRNVLPLCKNAYNDSEVIATADWLADWMINNWLNVRQTWLHGTLIGCVLQKWTRRGNEMGTPNSLYNSSYGYENDHMCHQSRNIEWKRYFHDLFERPILRIGVRFHRIQAALDVLNNKDILCHISINFSI